jgi:CDGSH-type Zn-finger protein
MISLMTTQDDSANITVTPTKDGPLEIVGAVRVVSADGTTMREASRVYLCRCGHSTNKPFCDGAHSKNGFEDSGLGKAPATP